MIIKLFEDRDGKPIDTENIYKDVTNKVDDIRIVEMDGNYYALPEDLDKEPLESVCNGLVVQWFNESLFHLLRMGEIKLLSSEFNERKDILNRYFEHPRWTYKGDNGWKYEYYKGKKNIEELENAINIVFSPSEATIIEKNGFIMIKKKLLEE